MELERGKLLYENCQAHNFYSEITRLIRASKGPGFSIIASSQLNQLTIADLIHRQTKYIKKITVILHRKEKRIKPFR